MDAEGAAAWFQDDLGWTSLHYATETGNAELCELLLGNGAVWNIVDNTGNVSLPLVIAR